MGNEGQPWNLKQDLKSADTNAPNWGLPRGGPLAVVTGVVNLNNSVALSPVTAACEPSAEVTANSSYSISGETQRRRLTGCILCRLSRGSLGGTL